MLTKTKRKELIEKIRRLPKLLDDAVEGLNARQLGTPYGKGKWTICQVVHHIADAHVNAYIRFRLILTEDHPTIKPYDQDAWAALSDASFADVAPSLDIVRGIHQRWSEMMDEIDDRAWSRTGYHPEHGEMSLEDLLVTYAEHGEHHLGQIVTARTEFEW